MKEEIKNYFNEWNDLIEELSEKEIEHISLKEKFEREKNHILINVNFKELYGKNNDDIRKMHIKQETSLLIDKIKTLELSINYIKRRISFLKNITGFYKEEL